MPKGEWLLQTAAGSTLGRQLIVLAQQRGVRTINIVRRKAQVQELLDIGARPCCWRGSEIAGKVCNGREEGVGARRADAPGM